MSASADVLQRPDLVAVAAQEKTNFHQAAIRKANSWDPDSFAREQIRGLVRRVFFAADDCSVKQIVFSAADVHTDAAKICLQVGQALVLETRSDIALVNRGLADQTDIYRPHYFGKPSIKSWSTQIATNLWRVPECKLRQCAGEIGNPWPGALAELRNEFEYAIIHAPAADGSSEAALLGHLTDGMVLVLGAHSSRKASVCKVKQNLQSTGSRILGIVLSERRFPVPEAIYRRL